MTTKTSYSRLQIALHWLIAIAVVAAYFTHDGMGRLVHQKVEGAATGTPVHVYLGLAVFVLALIRIPVRLLSKAPPVNDHGKRWLKIASSAGHGVLYLLMLFVPLIGIGTWYFGNLPAGDVHGVLGNLFILAAGLHALIALGHHFVLKDDTLRRMIRIKA